MTAPSSTVEATNDLPISLASSKHYTKAEIENIHSDIWEELYQKDKFFRLYTPDYHGWRYTIYGDDLANITSSVSLCWLHVETWIPSPRKRDSLENFWSQEGTQ
jgi:hypothetical protein